MYIEKYLLNLLTRGWIIRRRRQGRFLPPCSNDSNPMDVILLSYELFGGDHQLVQVVHDAESRADSDAVVP